MALGLRTSAVGDANNTSATITVPAASRVGDVILVQLSQNNTDAVTAAPSNLTLLDNDTTTSSTFPNRLYQGVIDGITLSPSSVLTWSLSATRAWAINLTVWTGMDIVNPLVQTIAKSAAVTSTVTMPSITTTANSYLVELASVKSNGTTITTWTVAAGWTSAAVTPAISTFAGSAVSALRNIDITTPGTYGGETYTPSSAPAVVFTYIVPLNPRPQFTNNNYQFVKVGDGMSTSEKIR